MYRIRFHGRGGQGVKTASRMLGTSFFLSGYQVQDAPRYGAERRGAPIFAYVRTSRHVINERGIIVHPDLILVADESLIGVPAAGVLQGITEDTVILVITTTSAEAWTRRLNSPARILCLAPPVHVDDPLHDRYLGAYSAGAAARLIGELSFDDVERGMRREMTHFGAEVAAENLAIAKLAFDAVSPYEGIVIEGLPFKVTDHSEDHWINLHAESVNLAAPAIHQGLTSVQVRTGLWRTMRPIIDEGLCKRCNWVCSNYCPDNAIRVKDDGYPEIDLEHCKGCMICVAQCPPHAIETIAESVIRAREEAA